MRLPRPWVRIHKHIMEMRDRFLTSGEGLQDLVRLLSMSELSDVQWRMIESMMIYVWEIMRYKISWSIKN